MSQIWHQESLMDTAVQVVVGQFEKLLNLPSSDATFMPSETPWLTCTPFYPSHYWKKLLPLCNWFFKHLFIYCDHRQQGCSEMHLQDVCVKQSRLLTLFNSLFVVFTVNSFRRHQKLIRENKKATDSPFSPLTLWTVTAGKAQLLRKLLTLKWLIFI